MILGSLYLEANPSPRIRTQSPFYAEPRILPRTSTYTNKKKVNNCSKNILQHCKNFYCKALEIWNLHMILYIKPTLQAYNANALQGNTQSSN